MPPRPHPPKHAHPALQPEHGSWALPLASAARGPLPCRWPARLLAHAPARARAASPLRLRRSSLRLAQPLPSSSQVRKPSLLLCSPLLTAAPLSTPSSSQSSLLPPAPGGHPSFLPPIPVPAAPVRETPKDMLYPLLSLTPEERRARSHRFAFRPLADEDDEDDAPPAIAAPAAAAPAEVEEEGEEVGGGKRKRAAASDLF